MTLRRDGKREVRDDGFEIGAIKDVIRHPEVRVLASLEGWRIMKRRRPSRPSLRYGASG
jgi:hypothetical protein